MFEDNSNAWNGMVTTRTKLNRFYEVYQTNNKDWKFSMQERITKAQPTLMDTNISVNK